MILIGLVLLVTWARHTVSELPPGVTSCPRTDNASEYNNCIFKQLEALLPYFPKGIPSLKLPALDPLYLPSLIVDRNLDSLKIKANMSQIRAYGGTNFVIRELKVNPDDLTVFVKVQLPHIYVKGEYDVQGRLLLLSLNGIGSFKGNFSDIEAEVNSQGKDIIDKNGVQRIEVDKLLMRIHVGHGSIKLKAPSSHKLAADAAESFFNSNPRLVMDIAKPIIEDTATTVTRALASRVLSSLTRQELIP